MFIDRLLSPLEEDVPRRGVYDETRGYTVLEGAPLVATADGARTATETRVGGESRDPDAWAETTTLTKVSREDNDRD